MTPLVDLTGQRFGRLVVLHRVANLGKQPRWMCRCDCGETTEAAGGNLRDGNVKSCGCLRRTQQGNSYDENGKPSGTYSTWKAMIQRTTNPNHSHYYLYGERGITVCDRWRDFANFRADMGERPEGLTLDRIDPDGNYEPTNCRWATASEQQLNRRDRRPR